MRIPALSSPSPSERRSPGSGAGRVGTAREPRDNRGNAFELLLSLSSFAKPARGYCLRGLDGHWRGRHRDTGHGLFQRAE